MPKYSVDISYDGSKFSGWQIQPGCVTVQQKLEESLTLLNGTPVKVSGAGRTDAGVHARAQTASFMMNHVWEERRLLLAVNAHLPEGASVTKVVSRPADFDARHDALWREYVFFVWRGSFCYPQMKPFVWWKKKDDWNHEFIRQGCRILVGRHNFSAFCRQSDVPENPFRTIYRISYSHRGPLSFFRVRGDAFLTNMIRIMVGNLDCVGSGRFPLLWLEDLLACGRKRIDSAMTVPPSGLFFWRAGYKADHGK